MQWHRPRLSGTRDGILHRVECKKYNGKRVPAFPERPYTHASTPHSLAKRLQPRAVGTLATPRISDPGTATWIISMDGQFTKKVSPTPPVRRGKELH